MFNKENMDPTTAAAAPAGFSARAKLSSGKSIGLRSPELREKLEALHADLSRRDAKLGLSDLLRDGTLAFWPQIESYLRARTAKGVPTADLARVTLICATLLEHGLTAEQVEAALEQLLEQHLCPELGEGTHPGPVAAGNGATTASTDI
jgi:hypothetical protein